MVLILGAVPRSPGLARQSNVARNAVLLLAILAYMLATKQPTGVPQQAAGHTFVVVGSQMLCDALLDYSLR